MLRLGVYTKKSVREALAEAERYFTGLGLVVESAGIDSVRLTGGGGFVEARAIPNEGRPGCELDVSTGQWDSQVRDFARRIAG